MERCLSCGAVAWAAIDHGKAVRIPLCRACIAVLDAGRDVRTTPKSAK